MDKNWKDKTCEKCEYMVGEWCRYNPMGIRKTDQIKVEDRLEWKTIYQKACSKYEELYER